MFAFGDCYPQSPGFQSVIVTLVLTLFLLPQPLAEDLVNLLANAEDFFPAEWRYVKEESTPVQYSISPAKFYDGKETLSAQDTTHSGRLGSHLRGGTIAAGHCAPSRPTGAHFRFR